MADNTKDAALVAEVGAKVDPPFTDAEVRYAESLVEKGADPIQAAEMVLDERVAASARAVRERDGSPYPPLESLLDESVQKRRAKAKVDSQFGDDEGGAVSPDIARLQAALQAAQEENARLAEENAAKEAQITATGNSLADFESLAQKVADLQRENEELRGTGGGTPQASAPSPGGSEQTGPGSASTKKTTPKDGA